MKHSLVLLLGLTSLVLSSAPAYANDPLNFDPVNSDSSKFDPLQLTIDRPHALAQQSAELPIHPKQQDRSIDAASTDRVHPTNAVEASPFEFPDDVTDADLFESEFEPIQADPELARSSSAANPGLKFESTDAEFDQLFNSLQSDWPQSTSDRTSDRISDRTSDRISDHKVDDAETSTRQTTHRDAGKNGDRSRVATSESLHQPHPSDKDSIGLDFNPGSNLYSSQTSSPEIAAAPTAPSTPTAPEPPAQKDASSDGPTQDELENLFTGESDSIVAIAVGSAEGTRTPDGSKNPAYQGHTDPGNGVWNLGSFSYQHGASSPEEADAKQLTRLRTQAKTIFDKATSKGLNLTLEEKLNGIDLANQAPKAALDEHGYIDRLAEAHGRGLSGSDAILWARVQSFIDPRTQTWDAPGLGNSEDRITRDQERRMLAIAKAIANYLQEIANRPSQKPAEDQAAQKSSAQPTEIAQLFTQPFMNLFASASSEMKAAMKADAQVELPIVQQILDLDLSGEMFA